jgi:MFS transporter, DHA1 family, inner membrane transport protein
MQKRGQALALVVLGLMVATVFGSPLGTWMGSHMSWRYSFGLVALLAGIAFLALLLGKLPQAGEAPSLSLKARLAPIGKPSLLLALAPALLWNLGMYVIYTYLAPLLHHSLMLNDVSGFLLVFGLGLVGGNWLAGVIADRFGTTYPLSLSLIALTIIYVTFSFTDVNPVSALIVLFIWGALGSLAFLAQQRRLLDLAAEHANVILALNNSTLYLGIAGGAALGGVVLQFAPINALGEIGAAFVILALLTLLVSIRVHTQR